MINEIAFDKYKSAILIQLKFKETIKTINYVNDTLNKFNNTICNLVHNINYQFKLELYDKQQYTNNIEIIDSIHTLYKNIKLPITINIFKRYTKIELLYLLETVDSNIKKFCLLNGTLDITSIIKLFYPNYYKTLQTTFKNIINFYDDFFITLNVNVITNKKTIKDIYLKNKIENIDYPFEKILNNGKNNFITNLNGCSLYIPITDILVKIDGIFKDDPINVSHYYIYLSKKKIKIHKDIEYLNVPDEFKFKFLEQLSLRDHVVLSTREITHKIKENYDELLSLKDKSLSGLVKDFIKSSQERQRIILTLLLLDDEEHKMNANIIFDLIANELNLFTAQPTAHTIYNSLHFKLRKEFVKQFKKSEEKKNKLKQMTMGDINYESRIASMKCDDKIKMKALEKFKEINGTKENSIKAQIYLDNLLKIPFDNYVEESVLKYLDDFKKKIKIFINNFNEKFNNLKQYFENSSLDGALYIKTVISNLFDEYINVENDKSEITYSNYMTIVENIYIKLLLFLCGNNRKTSIQNKINDNIDSLISKEDYNNIDNIVNNCIYKEIKKSESLTSMHGSGQNLQEYDDEDYSEDDLNYYVNVINNKNVLTDIEKKNINDNVSDKISYLIKENKIPSQLFIENCLKKINHYKTIKETLINIDGLTENNIKLLRDKINEIEESLGLSLSDESIDKDESDDNSDYNDKNVLNFIEAIVINLIDLYKEYSNFKLEKINYLKKCEENLNKCVHGHDNSKKSILRLIGQWINGKNNGSCIGLCGPPGVGKTTLCKNGLAKCLINENGESRPIAFLALGGATNGSILEGHSYTYLGSTWGKIVDILIETECMNPIIYIDELDKISMSEHGREISGILTHITDKTQNMEFEDKYFAGVKIDLSKILFVFSYNDSSKIDRILKDRITEININPLSKIDKLVITQKYVFPEILETVGFSNKEILLSDRTTEIIIDKYTYEAGVRKLNEILFDIVRELNLKKIMNSDINFPYSINLDFITELMLDKPEIVLKKIANKPMIGLINGMYATASGIGGITIIQVNSTPSEKKLNLETLTGSQGDVMKESMNCALTVAWNVLPIDIKKKLNEDKSCYGGCGLHIHCPDTSTPKDGPSAGTAITLAIISALCNIRILNTVAITGEIDLIGNVHKIGGVDAKINGAILAGVTKILLPEDNRLEYNKFYNDVKKNKNENENIVNAEIIFINHITDTFEHIFVENELKFNKII